MSFVKADTGDSLNDFFTDMADFMNISGNLLKADTLQVFIVWFEKLELINKRSLFLFLKQHKKEIRPQFIKWAQERFTLSI